MHETRFDVTGIGNALVDIISNTDNTFLRTHNITKGAMTLIDEERAQALYQEMGPTTEVSGGSCANTIAGLASLGAKSAYMGKVGHDALGSVFIRDLKGLGVYYDTPPATGECSTGRCYILVTPDAERSMNTFLGASNLLGPDDVDEDLIKASAICYMEGYLWDPPSAKDAFIKAAGAAHAADRTVSLTLSDAFCVDRFRDEFRLLVKDEVDLLFANEEEILSLYQTEALEEALQKAGADCQCVAVTRSAAGSVLVAGGETLEIVAEHADQVIDTTGAGDLYAAGFLAGFSRGRSLANCGQLGSLVAAEVLSHYGPRPETSLKDLASAKNLL